VEGRRKLATRLGVLVVVFFAFELAGSLFIASYAAGSASMAPTILPGELVLAAPIAYGPSTFFGRLPGLGKPERGDLVLAEPPFAPARGFWTSLADSLVRFVTFQRASLHRRGARAVFAGPMIQRVVGTPGDTIAMEDFVFKVRPAGSEHFLTEFELSSRRYDISREVLPDGWREGMPGSGGMPALILGKDEYFLAGDARSSSSDSRSWGTIGLERFRAKVLLRYWPPSRFGSL
jgi:signal peptidase I